MHQKHFKRIMEDMKTISNLSKQFNVELSFSNQIIPVKTFKAWLSSLLPMSALYHLKNIRKPLFYQRYSDVFRRYKIETGRYRWNNRLKLD